MQLLGGVIGAAAGLLAGPLLARVAIAFPPRPHAPGRVIPARAAVRPQSVIVLVSAGSAVLIGAVAAALGWRADLPPYVVLAALGTALAATDVLVHRLPDVLVGALLAAGLLDLGVTALVRGDLGPLGRALLAGVIVFLVATMLTLAGGMGFGDAKLLGVLGLYLGWLGWVALLRGLVLGILLGALLGLVLMLARRAGWRSAIALGPALVIGAVLSVIS